MCFLTHIYQKGCSSVETTLWWILFSGKVVSSGRAVWGMISAGLGLGVYGGRGCRSRSVCGQGGVDILGWVVTWFVTILEWVQSSLTTELNSRDPGLFLSQPYWTMTQISVSWEEMTKIGVQGKIPLFLQVLPRPGGWRSSHHLHFLLWLSSLSSARLLLCGSHIGQATGRNQLHFSKRPLFTWTPVGL